MRKGGLSVADLCAFASLRETNSVALDTSRKGAEPAKKNADTTKKTARLNTSRHDANNLRFFYCFVPFSSLYMSSTFGTAKF